MKCKNCNEKIKHVKLHVFDRFGGDDFITANIGGGGRWGCSMNGWKLINGDTSTQKTLEENYFYKKRKTV